ncbi:hypothetical protein AGMMS50230_01950 [Spirochaetia bacterium]|nr:hypothetical protein AGMMS50230_01950 [Spirochaetia bacterium]
MKNPIKGDDFGGFDRSIDSHTETIRLTGLVQDLNTLALDMEYLILFRYLPSNCSRE